jgi:hypothetical protein
MRRLRTSAQEDTKMNMPWKIIWTGLRRMLEFVLCPRKGYERSELCILGDPERYFVWNQETDSYRRPEVLPHIIAKYRFLSLGINIREVLYSRDKQITWILRQIGRRLYILDSIQRDKWRNPCTMDQSVRKNMNCQKSIKLQYNF